jgi:hypothetical protein
LILAEVHHRLEPFPYFWGTGVFDPEGLAALESLFDADPGWQHRDEAFYKCFLRDCTDELSVELREQLVVRMRQITGLPLSDHIEITAQRMEPGQQIGIHSDRPLVGFEIARLVVQLNRDWKPEHGGVLELFSEPEGRPLIRVLPRYNMGFGFMLHADSHHSVTLVTAPRRSVVFNFWHPANLPELGEEVEALFTDIHFSTLPAIVADAAAKAEAIHPEEVTYHASLAAIALQRWGYDHRTIRDGYLYSTGHGGTLWAQPVAVRMADWVACLYRHPFDLGRWEILMAELDGATCPERLESVWGLIVVR